MISINFFLQSEYQNSMFLVIHTLNKYLWLEGTVLLLVRRCEANFGEREKERSPGALRAQDA